MPSQAAMDAHRAFAERLGKNLLSARKAAGISQEMLSFEASLHRTQVGMLERGVRIPRLDTALKLAIVLGISVDELVEGIEWSPPVLGGGQFRAAAGEDPVSR